jgi:hypothetical protein
MVLLDLKYSGKPLLLDQAGFSLGIELKTEELMVSNENQE